LKLFLLDHSEPCQRVDLAAQIFHLAFEYRAPDTSEIFDLEFKGKIRRIEKCSVSAAIGINQSILDVLIRLVSISVAGKIPSGSTSILPTSSKAAPQDDDQLAASITLHRRKQRGAVTICR